jgi:hypothetical protein
VYNLVAEDTVEARIYQLLEEKLLEIARTIGKVDAVTGEVVEDFRSEILGFLGSSPNYQDLYKKALVDRDYRRTEREMAEAIERARRASEALRALAQDLDTFNLEHYRTIRGHFTLKDLRVFVERAILRLGGAFIPNGEIVAIETPEILLSYPGVVPRYRESTFERDVAMRRRNVQLLGLGHPLVDSVIRHLQRPQQAGDVCHLGNGAQDAGRISVRALFHLELERGRKRSVYVNLLLTPDGSWEEAPPRFDVDLLAKQPTHSSEAESGRAVEGLDPIAEQALDAVGARLRATTDGVVSIRHTIVGLAA